MVVSPIRHLLVATHWLTVRIPSAGYGGWATTHSPELGDEIVVRIWFTADALAQVVPKHDTSMSRPIVVALGTDTAASVPLARDRVIATATRAATTTRSAVRTKSTGRR